MTIALVIAASIALSVAPVPDWARPLELFTQPEPLRALASIALKGGATVAAAGVTEEAPQARGDAEEEPQKEEVQPAKREERTPWVEPPREKYHRVRQEVSAAPEPISNPCVEGTEEACDRRALDRFFFSLSEVEAGVPDAIVRVVHYGDSLIASDHITDLVRLRLHQRFGSAGRGFLLVDRLSRFGRRVRSGTATENWKKDAITFGKLPDRHFGYTGVSFTADKDGESSSFEVGPNRWVEIFLLKQPGSGALEISADDKLLRTVETASEVPETTVEGLLLAEGTQTLKLKAKSRGVRVFGVSLEAGVPGIVYETIGLPGATFEVWMLPDEEDFSRQLVHRDPRLVVTMLGGNDGLMLSKKKTTLEKIEENTNAFLARLRKAAPDADCLVVSPMDAARTSVGGEIVSKEEVPQIVELQKRLSQAHGCAFWNMWQSMGGSGSLARWHKQGMINADMIHPKGYGGDLLGEMMVSAMMEAYDRWASSADLAAVVQREPQPSAEAESPLAPYFAKLSVLEQEKRGRVAMAVFGSSNVARHYFTDEVRSRLGAKFGTRGRGYNSCGRGAKVLDDAGVHRQLSGRFALHDGTEQKGSELSLVGMSGIRTELPKGARFIYMPCVRCGRAPGVFELYYLSRPGMGRADVTTTGASRAVLGRSVPNEPELSLKRIATSAAKAKLTVDARGPGSVELLGVAHEFDRPGIVVDTVAYPGVTPGIALKWDQSLVLGMIAKRRPDLLVLFYGDAEAAAARIDEEAYSKDYARLLKRLREGTDDAPCVIVSAAPGQLKSGDRWAEWPALSSVRRIQEQVAAGEGCAFWPAEQLFADHAGKETSYSVEQSWRAISNEGLKRLGEAFTVKLLGEYERWNVARERANPQEAAARTPPG
jgi:hypothetical protein